MINFSVNVNELILKRKTLTFNYPIYKAEEYNNYVIILLEFKNNNNPSDFFNELYAISDSGHIAWKMEDVKRVLGKFEPDPLVNFVVYDNKLIAVDFCSRKHMLNPVNGKILDVQTGRW